MQTWDQIVWDVQNNFYIYLSMPFIAAFIGWWTKLVAIKMMFRPHEYKGKKPFGWQGIIPRRAPQMVDVLCETLTGRLISSDEIVERVDGKKLATMAERPLRAEIARITPEIAAEYQSTVWHLLPGTARDVVIQRAQDKAPLVLEELIDGLGENIDEVFDLPAMVTEEFLASPDVLEKMFLDVGRREFAFIRHSGLIFGFCIGIVQALAWAVFHNPWLMPLFGVFTGWFTDWAALRLIFQPKEPKRYLGVIKWHGLFLKHRIPVSQEYGELIAGHVLTADRLIKGLCTGSKREEFIELVTKHIEDAVHDESLGLTELLSGGSSSSSPLSVGGLSFGSLPFGKVISEITDSISEVTGAGSIALDQANLRPMCRAAAADIVDALPEVMSCTEAYLDDVLGIKETMSEKMAAMTPDEFENVLRPAFKQDESTLITVGAILGGAVGELQVVYVKLVSTPIPF